MNAPPPPVWLPDILNPNKHRPTYNRCRKYQQAEALLNDDQRREFHHWLREDALLCERNQRRAQTGFAAHRAYLNTRPLHAQEGVLLAEMPEWSQLSEDAQRVYLDWSLEVADHVYAEGLSFKLMTIGRQRQPAPSLPFVCAVASVYMDE